MSPKLAAFLSNGGYATWFQSLIVVVSVAVAVWAIKETDTNAAVSTSVGLAEKYFTEKPTLASASLRLRISQYQQVQEAKKTINGYDPKNDPDYTQLFKTAQPLVAAQISKNSNLQDDYNVLNDFFSAVLICAKNRVCDQTTSIKLLAWEILGYYNAVCPFMKDYGRQFGYDEDTPRYIAFLVGVAGYADPKLYFCRDGLPK